jgi:hypothetical protein
MLFRCGVAEDVGERICQIIAMLRKGDSDDSLEARIVSAAMQRTEGSDSATRSVGD